VVSLDFAIVFERTVGAMTRGVRQQRFLAGSGDLAPASASVGNWFEEPAILIAYTL